jgi:hypothetical protein
VAASAVVVSVPQLTKTLARRARSEKLDVTELTDIRLDGAPPLVA